MTFSKGEDGVKMKDIKPDMTEVENGHYQKLDNSGDVKGNHGLR